MREVATILFLIFWAVIIFLILRSWFRGKDKDNTRKSCDVIRQIHKRRD